PIESVGKIVPSCTIKILDGQGKELPDGEEGEIVICGPMLMLGYIGQTDETGKVIEGTCYHTGDIGHMDKGYLFISGRAKEMINVAGNKVFPAEVEGALKNCPLVKEVAVIGVENSKLGQIVKAHIVTTDESLSNDLKNESTAKAAKATLKEKLREFCGQNLKRELRPMEWVFYPADHVLPRTLSGKIDKKQLS
ncbi:MAG: long-chain acyl-CoA synthetase, partial [Cyanobacteriota bacterium erpe_2018_sw_39hr_WHONDRS-SW48-000098_B_bin.30]|nr:long-chain acyl-CoA synthetase [Cyanobacteriota bacterium erpe_2018_sw_39hr_WHONDRS-SW48-000098_B_bin.30]